MGATRSDRNAITINFSKLFECHPPLSYVNSARFARCRIPLVIVLWRRCSQKERSEGRYPASQDIRYPISRVLAQCPQSGAKLRNYSQQVFEIDLVRGPSRFWTRIDANSIVKLVALSGANSIVELVAMGAKAYPMRRRLTHGPDAFLPVIVLENSYWYIARPNGSRDRMNQWQEQLFLAPYAEFDH
jgi:hypothetical protein